ncbi:hypothetical protein U0070_001280, partial [Myodes glareolus]
MGLGSELEATWPRVAGSANQSPRFKLRQRPQLQLRLPKVPRPLRKPHRKGPRDMEEEDLLLALETFPSYLAILLCKQQKPTFPCLSKARMQCKEVVSTKATCVSLSGSGSGATPNTGLNQMTSCIGCTVEIGALSLGVEQEVPVAGAFVLEALM